MRKTAPALLLLLVAGHAAAQAPPAPRRAAPVVKVADVSGDPGTFIVVAATTDAPAVKWVLLDTGLSLFPPALLRDARTAVVIGTVPGRYRILAYSGNADGPSEPAVAVITVNGPPGPPPPPPPNPNDPFTAAVRAAYAAETSPTKSAAVAAWATVYSTAAGMLDGPNYAVSTVADLLRSLDAAKGAMAPGTLPQVDRAIAAELAAAFGTDRTKALDRPVAKAELLKISAALGGLKGGK